MEEYKRLSVYEKQGWLIRKLNGLPNPKLSGDRGVDGDMKIHLGKKENKDLWGKLIFSVKTGKQKGPSLVRELIGTLKSENADMAVLIVDVDPTREMEEVTKKAGKFQYQESKGNVPKEIERVQIITSSQIIDGTEIIRPYSMQEIKNYRAARLI